MINPEALTIGGLQATPCVFDLHESYRFCRLPASCWCALVWLLECEASDYDGRSPTRLLIIALSLRVKASCASRRLCRRLLLGGCNQGVSQRPNGGSSQRTHHTAAAATQPLDVLLAGRMILPAFKSIITVLDVVIIQSPIDIVLFPRCAAGR